MSAIRPAPDVRPLEEAVRCGHIREMILLGLVLYTLVRTSEALAGDQASVGNPTPRSDVNNWRQSPAIAVSVSQAPANFTAPATVDDKTFSATEFRPRKHTVFDSDPAVNEVNDAPMLRSTTIWQRLSEYRSHDRVRLLTLWESRGSTVSLQTGRRGEPSLQWTSRLMNRGEATRGLLDRLFSTSLAGAGDRLRGAAGRPTSAQAPIKPVGTPTVAAAK